MQEISTLKRNWKPLAFSIIGLVMSVSALTTTAQTLCPNQVTLWSENFGTGTGSTTSADVTTLVYAPGNFPTTWLNDGFYRVSNGTQQRGDWHASADHTPSDVDGRALVINGVAETFYTKEISSNSVYNPGIYGFGFYLMNVNTNNYPCSPYLLPTIGYVIEYSTAPSGNSWVTLQSVSGTPAPITNAPVWLSMGGTFSLPVAAQSRQTLCRQGVAFVGDIVGGTGETINDLNRLSQPGGKQNRSNRKILAVIDRHEFSVQVGVRMRAAGPGGEIGRRTRFRF